MTHAKVMHKGLGINNLLSTFVACATLPDMAASTLLTTADVARRFDVSAQTVARWVKSGRLAAIRTPGGTYKFRLADVKKALATYEPEVEAS